MRRRWQFAFLCLIGWMVGGGAVAPRRAEAVDRPLLAHAAGDSLWVAAVVAKPPEPFTPASATAGPAVQTQVWVRSSQPGKPWRVLAVLPGRVTSMGCRDTQLAVLMAGGQWMTVFADGTASGQPLPAADRVVTLADDGQTLWAVGAVPGGIAAARAEIARQAAATRPTGEMPFALATRPTTAPAQPTTAASPGGPPALVLFRQESGRWAAVAELPAGVVASAPDDLSVVAVDRTATVASRAPDGTIRILRWRGDRWDDVVRLHQDAHRPATTFTLLSDAGNTLLWTTNGGTDPGTLLPITPDAPEPDGHPLRWVGPPPLAGMPAVAVSGGYLRLLSMIGVADGKPYEQRYELTGAPVGTPVEVVAPSDLGETTAMLWIQGFLLASLAFAIGTSVYRQVTPGSALAIASSLDARGGDDDEPAVVPAPLVTRAAAGAIDLLPLAGCTLIALVIGARHPDPPLSTGAIWTFVVGVVLYLAHTTVLETLTARTAGKWITGLRVATLDGGRPAPYQLVGRNLLRVLDPLIWIVLSPLRQRTADVLAGTVVVRESAAPQPPADAPPSPPTEPQT